MATKKTKGRGVIEETKTAYNFKNRDPIFDVVQAAVSESNMSYREIRNEGGASTTTVRNYMVGATRSGRHDTLMATLKAVGADVEYILPSGKRMKLLGGK